MATFPLYASNDPARPYSDIYLVGEGEGRSLEDVAAVFTDEGDAVPAGEYMLRDSASDVVLPVSVDDQGHVKARGARRHLPG